MKKKIFNTILGIGLLGFLWLSIMVFALFFKLEGKQLTYTVTLGAILGIGQIILVRGLVVRVLRPLKIIGETLEKNTHTYKEERIAYESADELGEMVGYYNKGVEDRQALQKINHTVASLEDFHVMIGYVYEHFKRFIPYNRIGVARISNGGLSVQPIDLITDGEVELGPGYICRLSETSLGKLIETGEARILNDLDRYYAEHKQSDSTRRILIEDSHASLTLPLFVKRTCIGFIFFSSTDKNIFTKKHIDYLEVIKDSLASAVEKEIKVLSKA